jgi:hypothetical protein
MREDPSKDSSTKDLSEQESVNLADESVSNLRSALRDGNAILEVVREIPGFRLVEDST